MSSEFKFNGNLINCGDDVIINGSKDKRFVGHVEKLYELEGSTDPNRAIVQWYFNYAELLKLSSRKIDVDIADSWRELFLLSSDNIHVHVAEDIDAETISKKCTVLRLKPHDLKPDCLHSTDQDDLFYVRYKLDKHFNLHPVSKRVARESISKRESSVTNQVKTLKTPRRASTRNQNLVKENDVSNDVKTAQSRKTPAKGKGKETREDSGLDLEGALGAACTPEIKNWDIIICLRMPEIPFPSTSIVLPWLVHISVDFL